MLLQHRRVTDHPPATGATGGREPSLVTLGAITCLSLEAALIHLSFMSEHFMEWWGYGLFFLGCAIGQAAYGPLLMWRRDSTALVQAGIWANTGVVALYVVTRIWGIPLGPHARMVESVGLLDLMSLVGELLLVVLLVRLLPTRQRRVTVNFLMVVGLLLWALRLGVGTVL
jgi:hypothetical protein